MPVANDQLQVFLQIKDYFIELYWLFQEFIKEKRVSNFHMPYKNKPVKYSKVQQLPLNLLTGIDFTIRRP